MLINSADYTLAAHYVGYDQNYGYKFVISDKGNETDFYLPYYDSSTGNIAYIEDGVFADSFVICSKYNSTRVAYTIVSSEGKVLAKDNNINWSTGGTTIYSRLEVGVTGSGNIVIAENAYLHILDQSGILHSVQMQDSSGESINKGSSYQIVPNSLGFSLIWSDSGKSYIQSYDNTGATTSALLQLPDTRNLTTYVIDSYVVNDDTLVVFEQSKLRTPDYKITVSHIDLASNEVVKSLALDNSRLVDVEISPSSEDLFFSISDTTQTSLRTIWSLKSDSFTVEGYSSVPEDSAYPEPITEVDVFSVSADGSLAISPNYFVTDLVIYRADGSQITSGQVQITDSNQESTEQAIETFFSVTTSNAVGDLIIQATPPSISDVIGQLRHIVGLETLSGLNKAAADNDRDGDIDISDVIRSLRLIVGLESPSTAHLIDSSGNSTFDLIGPTTSLYAVAEGDTDLSWTAPDLV